MEGHQFYRYCLPISINLSQKMHYPHTYVCLVSDMVYPKLTKTNSFRTHSPNDSTCIKCFFNNLPFQSKIVHNYLMNCSIILE